MGTFVCDIRHHWTNFIPLTHIHIPTTPPTVPSVLCTMGKFWAHVASVQNSLVFECRIRDYICDCVITGEALRPPSGMYEKILAASVILLLPVSFGSFHFSFPDRCPRRPSPTPRIAQRPPRPQVPIPHSRAQPEEEDEVSPLRSFQLIHSLHYENCL